MQTVNGQTLFSASDVVNFLECEHLTTLDLINLDTPLPKAEDDDEVQLYARKGLALRLPGGNNYGGRDYRFAKYRNAGKIRKRPLKRP